MGKFFERKTIVRNLQYLQDFIVISLGIGLLGVMALEIGDLFVTLAHPRDVRVVTSDILFVLILIELFRLLLIYLQEQRVSIGAAVEVTMVAILREVILLGASDIEVGRLLAISVFLTVLGGLLLVRAYMSRIFEANSFDDPESDRLSDNFNESDSNRAKPQEFAERP